LEAEKSSFAYKDEHSERHSHGCVQGGQKYPSNLFRNASRPKIKFGDCYTIMSHSDRHGTATAKAVKAEVADLERMVSENPSSERACLKLAQILHVRRGEIALMRLEKGSLRFIYPVELRSAGVLPLSGSAVAARTAATKTSLLSNSFMRVKHVSLFEAVKISGNSEDDKSMEQMPIQKIMSVPVVAADGNVMGVAQVSRKGLDASVAGADFTADDLKLLEKAADVLAQMPFMADGAEF